MGKYGVVAGYVTMHGHWAGYQQGCRCQRCTAANDKHEARRLARRNARAAK